MKITSIQKAGKSNLLFIMLLVLISFAGGFLLNTAAGSKLFLKKSESSKNQNSEIKLPENLVKISGCIPFEGEHYVRPEDVPHGPFYVINEGKLMAIEYMFEDKDIPGETYAKMTFPMFATEMQKKHLELKDVVNELQSLSFDLKGAKYTYSDLHWTAPHAGETQPHYDIHFYLVPKEEMKNVCPDSTLQDVLPEDLAREIVKSGVPLPKP